MTTKNLALIPQSKIKKIILETEFEPKITRVSKPTLEYLSAHLKEYTIKLVKEANENCEFAKRKTISVADIEKALKE
ncbi:MAG: NFYB/HAP3 family transcription factor subunit [Candidatus Pacebacteria bacterium]|jgi:histone H3/H4|nr:NFYB/HAP3 family transcription factor subunit [Candidatus Paceibacterota bacterium]MDD3970128.1 NFYB/HAP3 family transcription factor subunit [Candidatus Paceibacterota bacterium]